jgi:hypothetical protein
MSPRDRAGLEAAREAKYRELRDSELDHRTGKLSTADYEAIRQALRAEALEILNRIEAIERRSGDLQQDDRIDEQKDRERDRPAVQVTLNHRAATERPGSTTDAERPGEPGILAGVHQHQQDEQYGNHDLKQRQERVHADKHTRESVPPDTDESIPRPF